MSGPAYGGDVGCRYFAYGSNLDHARLVERVGPVDLARATSARLVGHRLEFSKRSRTAGGAATVHPDPGGVVEGVLWTLTQRQLRRLDEIEGVPDHYWRVRVGLEVSGPVGGPAEDTGGAVAGWTYVAHPDRVVAGLRPTAAYLGHLLRGDRWLSGAYLDRLRAVETDP